MIVRVVVVREVALGEGARGQSARGQVAPRQDACGQGAWGQGALGQGARGEGAWGQGARGDGARGQGAEVVADIPRPDGFLIHGRQDGFLLYGRPELVAAELVAGRPEVIGDTPGGRVCGRPAPLHILPVPALFRDNAAALGATGRWFSAGGRGRLLLFES